MGLIGATSRIDAAAAGLGAPKAERDPFFTEVNDELADKGFLVTSTDDLRTIMANHKPGDSITLTVRRSGSTQTLKATLGSKT